MEFPEFLRFELGIYVEKFIMWLILEHGNIFDAITSGVLYVLINIEKFVLMVPWWVFIALVFIFGWRIKGLVSAFLYAGLFTLIGSFGLWELLMLTIAIVLTAVLISIILGIPIGILMAYKDGVETAMRPILDAMQTMPSFVYLIPAMMLFGMGKVPAIFATMIYAIPPVIRLTNLGIREVSKEMVEAAISFGSSPLQLLTRVQIPQAMPTIMAGINQTIMMALAMVVICSMIGAGGLGSEVLISINRIDIARGFEAGLAIVILAIVIDRLTQGISQKNQTSENN
ncbi:Glycine betaine/L-proline transport system permease protein ProW [Candidatus Syntrophocurvum alkaliphilum]|uniref:Glycine betaine/L-proline transport system permease protein ProW n=1 Tax=Candidatus Syntrophocurvum alkaliphilum TaxID=2293317 RepID=A0A6I6DGP7_9FIRM|nr:ABC transporter permease subunit [Candidatus Syntrophocurvum alkaliphilum]QGU00269.1 Glycine betaine/L-proline transport system permease protein ProW [Candidatus Syntrophocurvum alkaliphilum]